MGYWKIVVNGSAKDFAADYGFKIAQAPGTGFSPVENIYTEYGLLDGGLFQRTRTGVKSFSLVGTISGSSLGGLMGNRRALINAVKPDRTSPQEPVVVQYTGGTATVQASAYYDGGLELGNITSKHEPNVALRFVQFNPYWETANASGQATATSCNLTVQQTISNASRIIQYKPSSGWQTVGSGIDGGAIYSMLTDGNNLYAGGIFTRVNGSSACGIAKWDGSSWSLLDNVGFTATGAIFSMAMDAASNLYVGGNFTKIGGSSACRIAKWNGTKWSSVGADGGGSGFNDTVYTLEFDNYQNLFVGGNFTTINGSSASYIVRWNPVSGSWYRTLSNTTSGSGTSLYVYDIVADTSNNLYVAGNFQSVSGSNLSKGIVKWNNAASTWSAMGSGVSDTDYPPHTLTIDRSGDLYILGNFSDIGGKTAAGIARWNGTDWFALGNNNISFGVYEGGGDLFITKSNSLLIGADLNDETPNNSLNLLDNVVLWNGSQYLPLDINFPGDSYVNSFAEFDDGTLFVGYTPDVAGGAASAAGVTTIVNNGTTDTYPIVTVSGSGRLVSLKNHTTGENIYFGLSLQTGETLVLDMSIGIKTAISTFQNNVIDKIIPGSDFVKWHLAPGNNLIGLYINNPTASATISWVNRYWSIDN